MNGLQASAARAEQIIAGAREPAAQSTCWSARRQPWSRASPRRAQGSPVAIGGQDCHAEPSGAFTGDISAEMLRGRRRDRRHRRAFRAAHLSRRDRRRGARQGAGGLARGPHSPSSASARPRRSARPAQTLAVVGRQLDGSLPDGATGGDAGGRLRAGLGDRHRTDADAGRRRGGARLHPRALAERYGADRAGHAHPLRRLGQAVERRRSCCASPTSTARWSAARASRPRSSWRSPAPAGDLVTGHSGARAEPASPESYSKTVVIDRARRVGGAPE